MEERRSRKRWHTVLKAQIISKNQSAPLECTVRNLSDTGARIYFADTSALPLEFELEIPSKGLRVQSRRIWGRGANHGLQFLEKVKVWTDPLRAAVA
jgi:hypothetical protein